LVTTTKAKTIAGTQPKPKGQPKKKQRTPEEQRSEIKRVAREHGADLSEEEFNEALRKVGQTKA
jgi:hypothetical protein